MIDLDGNLMHTFSDFEEWAWERGYELAFGQDRFAALEKFANEHNYTVDELEDAGW